MEIENYVAIPLERYEQLIRAEHDANQLKSLLEDKHKDYGNIDYNEVCLLHNFYFGNKEENK